MRAAEALLEAGDGALAVRVPELAAAVLSGTRVDAAIDGTQP